MSVQMPVTAAPPRFRWRRSPSRAGRAGVLFALPALAIYVVFMVYPFLMNLMLSATNWNGMSADRNFVGLDNYFRLASDGVFWQALIHNLVWVVLGVSLPLTLGLGLAMLLWSRPRGFGAFRTILFMPQVLPSIVVAVAFAWIYDPNFGILDRTLEQIGLGDLSVPLLSTPQTSLFALIAISVWIEVSFAFVIFLAALQNVDWSLLDAAAVDGANAWQKFRHVTVPQVRNAITLVVVLLMIASFNTFDTVWILTQGGPNRGSELTATYLFKQAFRNTEVGYGATIAAAMTVVTLVVSIIIVRIRERGDQ
jgi:ABC-type sugar transport system permease subunit